MCGKEKWPVSGKKERLRNFSISGLTGSHHSRAGRDFGSCFGPWGMIRTVYTWEGKDRKQQWILCPVTGHPGDVLNC